MEEPFLVHGARAFLVSGVGASKFVAPIVLQSDCAYNTSVPNNEPKRKPSDTDVLSTSCKTVMWQIFQSRIETKREHLFRFCLASHAKWVLLLPTVGCYFLPLKQCEQCILDLGDIMHRLLETLVFV